MRTRRFLTILDILSKEHAKAPFPLPAVFSSQSDHARRPPCAAFQMTPPLAGIPLRQITQIMTVLFIAINVNSIFANFLIACLRRVAAIKKPGLGKSQITRFC